MTVPVADAPQHNGWWRDRNVIAFIEVRRQPYTRPTRPSEYAQMQARGQPPMPRQREESWSWNVYRDEAAFRRRARPLATIRQQETGTLLVHDGDRTGPKPAQTFAHATKLLAEAQPDLCNGPNNGPAEPK